MTATSFHDQLGEQLVVAHRRLARRRRRVRNGCVAAVFVVAAVLGAAAMLSTSSPVPADASLVEVTVQPDGWQLVRLPLRDATPREIKAGLDAAGVSNETIGVATGPSRVGKVLSITILGGSSRVVDATSVLLPVGFDGRISIRVGEPAGRGERYQDPSLAFDPGEPLDGFEPRDDAAAVMARADELGLKVQLMGPSGKLEKKLTPGARAEHVVMLSSSLVQINFR